MKLLIATDAWQPQVNGVVRTMGIVIDTMRARGHDVHVISPQDFRSMPCPGYPEIPLAFARPRRLARMIEDYAPDAIHIVTEGPIGFAARRACLRNGWHFTSAFHTRFPEYLRARAPIPVPLTHALFRRFHAASSNVLVPTQSILDDLRARGYGHLKLWTRGVNRTLFHPGRRSESGLPGPVFAYVGRLATEKNVAAFLELALPGSKLVVGDGPQRGELEKRFPDAVFVGAKTGESLAEAFASADVFVFPSRTDTFGLVILEALASGLPVVGFDYAAAAERVRNGVNGWLAPMKDEAAFIDAAVRVAGDEAQRRTMAANARDSVRDADWMAVTARLADIMEGVVRCHEVRAGP